MKRKTALIGLGTIAATYKKGIDSSLSIELVAVCDKDTGAASRNCYSTLPFFSDYKEMIERLDVERVIISTPPDTHCEIAEYCLSHGVGVMIEKPATLSLGHFDHLYSLAQKNALPFKTLFHWQGGDEVIELERVIDTKSIRQVTTKIYDPYSEQGTVIKENKRALGGAWIDSGVNALSMIGKWIELSECRIIECSSQKCKESSLPIYAEVKLDAGGVEICIEIDWREDKNKKESYISLSEASVYIDHSQQSFTIGEKNRECARTSRLDAHYINVFSESPDIDNSAFSRKIHKLLLEVNERL